MSTLTQVGNTSIEGNATTLADGDLDPSNDKVIVLDTSTSSLKRISAGAFGGGSFKGDSGGVIKDIFRVHEAQLDTNLTFDAGTNSLAAGPLTIASGITLTINGSVTIV